MTQLEKWAQEYATKVAQTYRGPNMVGEETIIDPDEYDAFIAGFKKARELAAKRMAKAAEDSCSCIRSDDYLYFEMQMSILGGEEA